MLILPNLPHTKRPSDPYLGMIYVQPNHPSCIIKFTPMCAFYICQYDIFIPSQGIKSSHCSCKTKHAQDIILEGPPSEMNKLSITRALNRTLQHAATCCKVRSSSCLPATHQRHTPYNSQKLWKKKHLIWFAFMGVITLWLSPRRYKLAEKEQSVWLRKVGFDSTVSIGTS